MQFKFNAEKEWRTLMSNALAKVQASELAALDEITSKDFAMVQADATKKFTTAFAVAAGVNKIKQTLTPAIMQEVILPLKDCGSLGFGTDEGSRNAGPYNAEVIKSCVTEALLRGAQLVGAEFMVFQGKTFFTKNYFERKVRSFPGLTNLDIQCSTPRMSTGGAVVEVLATFNLNGKPVVIDRRGTNAIAVRLQGSAGADVAVGKCEKRMLRHILNYVSGYAPAADPDEEETASTLKVVSNEVTLSEDAQGNITADATVTPSSTPAQSANVSPAVVGETPQGGNETAKRMIKGKKKDVTPAVELPPPTAPAKAAAPVSQEAPPPVAEQSQSEPGEEPGLEEEPSESEEPAEESTPTPIVCAVQKVTIAIKDKKYRVTTDQGDFFIFDMAQGKEFLTMKTAGKRSEITYEEVTDKATGAIERIVKTFKAV
jgi:hypothetical protein